MLGVSRAFEVIASKSSFFSPVERFLNVHGGGPEGFEGDDDVGHVELGLQVQLDGNILFPITRLSGELGSKV